MSRPRGGAKGYIEQRGPNSFRLNVYIGLDERGKQQYARRTFHGTKTEAQQELHKLATEVAQNRYVPPKRITVEQWLRSWLEYYVSRRRPKTVSSYRRTVEGHLIPVLGRKQLSELRPEDIRRYMKSKEESGRLNHKGEPTGKPLGATSVRYHFRILHAALEKAVEEGLLAENPADRAKGARPDPVDWEPDVPTPEEGRKLLKAALEETELGAMWLILLTTGLRRGEALGVRWVDLDLDEGLLHVAQQVQRVDGQFHFQPPKSKKGRRTVPLLPVVVDALKAHRKRQLAYRLQIGEAWQDHGLVFCNPFGGPLDPDTVTKHYWPALLKKAGMRKVRLHDTRHAVGSFLTALEVPTRTVQELLGHSGITTTQRYTHVAPALGREALEKLGALLGLDTRSGQASS